MKPPKRISDILKHKQDIINAGRDQLDNSFIRLQSRLMDQIVSDIIPFLDVKDGEILDTANNYKLVSELDKVFRDFKVLQAEILLPQLNKVSGFIANVTRDYFFAVISDIPIRFENIIESAKKITDLRFGLQNGKFVRGGLIESLINEFGSTEVKQLMSRAVTSQMNLRDFIRQMQGFVAGTEDKPGISERKFKQFTFDVYQQYDAAYNSKLADEFEMRYFIYQGGLIEDSRDFCVAHDNKVWSIEEAEKWQEWTPSKGGYPEGYEVKAKDQYSVPGYMNYPGYDPIIDRGGYNCRHQLGFISEELAFKLRPDLKNVS